MTRREAARALRDTLRELTTTTADATKFASHATGVVLTSRHELVPAVSLVRETATLLQHAAENLARLVSARPAATRKSRRRSSTRTRRSAS